LYIYLIINSIKSEMLRLQTHSRLAQENPWREPSVKITFHEAHLDSFYLDQFPSKRDELILAIKFKCPHLDCSHLSLYFKDIQGDDIAIKSDKDLGHLRQAASVDPNLLVKITVRRSPDAPSSDAPSEDCLEELLTQLKNQMPKISTDFEMGFDYATIPCKICMGTGRIMRKKCSNCNGRGHRPLEKKWEFILKLIDYKFYMYLYKPLEEYLSRKKKREEPKRRPGEPSPPSKLQTVTETDSSKQIYTSDIFENTVREVETNSNIIEPSKTIIRPVQTLCENSNRNPFASGLSRLENTMVIPKGSGKFLEKPDLNNCGASVEDPQSFNNSGLTSSMNLQK
jgi:hypothetical protein